MNTWMCLICGWIYNEEEGLPEEGIAPGTAWKDVPINWVCPECGARAPFFCTSCHVPTCAPPGVSVPLLRLPIKLDIIFQDSPS